MRKIPTTNVSLRVSEQLKRDLEAFSEQHELHASFVLRQALVLFLRGRLKDATNTIAALASPPTSQKMS